MFVDIFSPRGRISCLSEIPDISDLQVQFRSVHEKFLIKANLGLNDMF